MSLSAWMDGYLRAWTSGDAAEIGDLFTDDAFYDPQTGGDPWVGREAIIDGWQDIADEPGSWTFTWQPLVEMDGLAVIVGRTEYRGDEPDYRNLWTIRLTPDGRCREFTEWWIAEDG